MEDRHASPVRISCKGSYLHLLNNPDRWTEEVFVHRVLINGRTGFLRAKAYRDARRLTVGPMIPAVSL